MKKILVLAIVALCFVGLFAESDGAKGFKSLTIYSTAEEAAQGGTGSFSSSNALVFFNNPAASLFDKSLVASINQNYWLFNTSMNSFGIRNSLDKVATVLVSAIWIIKRLKGVMIMEPRWEILLLWISPSLLTQLFA